MTPEHKPLLRGVRAHLRGAPSAHPADALGRHPIRKHRKRRRRAVERRILAAIAARTAQREGP